MSHSLVWEREVRSASLVQNDQLMELYPFLTSREKVSDGHSEFVYFIEGRRAEGRLGFSPQPLKEFILAIIFGRVRPAPVG